RYVRAAAWSRSAASTCAVVMIFSSTRTSPNRRPLGDSWAAGAVVGTVAGVPFAGVPFAGSRDGFGPRLKGLTAFGSWLKWLKDRPPGPGQSNENAVSRRPAKASLRLTSALAGTSVAGGFLASAPRQHDSTPPRARGETTRPGAGEQRLAGPAVRRGYELLSRSRRGSEPGAATPRRPGLPPLRRGLVPRLLDRWSLLNP